MSFPNAGGGQYTVVAYQGKKKMWYWRVKAGNNKIVADSAEGYHNRQHCARMINRLFPTLLVQWE